MKFITLSLEDRKISLNIDMISYVRDKRGSGSYIKLKNGDVIFAKESREKVLELLCENE